mgnify:CR=1 FL=1
MTIEHIMLLASVAQTPRDWAEVRAAILALLDAEAEACAEVCDGWSALQQRGTAYCASDIRARIAGRRV